MAVPYERFDANIAADDVSIDSQSIQSEDGVMGGQGSPISGWGGPLGDTAFLGGPVGRRLAGCLQTGFLVPLFRTWSAFWGRTHRESCLAAGCPGPLFCRCLTVRRRYRRRPTRGAHSRQEEQQASL